jgi:GNAT superfamily N-acetyltransferase
VDPLLDNVIWHALTGPQARFSTGTTTARRYAPGFSPIAGFADRSAPDLDAFAPFVAPGEHLYCDGWQGAVPPGWHIETEATMYRMLWSGEPPAADDSLQARPLAAPDAAAAVELATLTRPGPFGPRTIELGESFGVFEGDLLVAMAGERMHAGTFREVSGVCTRPGHQGRGLARRLMHLLIRRQMQRGETPFLHVMTGNAIAHRLYQHMGFRVARELGVRVVARDAPAT